MATGDGGGNVHLREVALSDSLFANAKNGEYPVNISAELVKLFGTVPDLVQQQGGRYYVDYTALLMVLSPAIHVADKANESIFMTHVSIKTLDALMRLSLPHLVQAKSLVELQSQVFASIQMKNGFAAAAKAAVVEIVDVVAPVAVIQELTRSHQSFINAMTASTMNYALLADKNGFLSAGAVFLLLGLPQTTVANTVEEALALYTQWDRVFTQLAPHYLISESDQSFLSKGEMTINLSQTMTPSRGWLTPANLAEPQSRLRLLFAWFSSVTGNAHGKKLAEKLDAEVLLSDEVSFPLLCALADRSSDAAPDKLTLLGEATKVPGSLSMGAKAARIEAVLRKLDNHTLESLEGPDLLVRLTAAVEDAQATDNQFNKNTKLHSLLGTSKVSVFGELTVLAAALAKDAFEQFMPRELGSLSMMKFLLSGGVNTGDQFVQLHDTPVGMFTAKCLFHVESNLLIPNQILQDIASLVLRDREKYMKYFVLSHGCSLNVEADEYMGEVPPGFYTRPCLQGIYVFLIWLP